MKKLAIVAALALCAALPAQAVSNTLTCAKAFGKKNGDPIDVSTLEVVTTPGKAVFRLNGYGVPFDMKPVSETSDNVLYKGLITDKGRAIKLFVNYIVKENQAWVTYSDVRESGANFLVSGFECRY